jgi:hypothetical protein
MLPVKATDQLLPSPGPDVGHGIQQPTDSDAADIGQQALVSGKQGEREFCSGCSPNSRASINRFNRLDFICVRSKGSGPSVCTSPRAWPRTRTWWHRENDAAACRHAGTQRKKARYRSFNLVNRSMRSPSTSRIKEISTDGVCNAEYEVGTKIMFHTFGVSRRYATTSGREFRYVEIVAARASHALRTNRLLPLKEIAWINSTLRRLQAGVVGTPIA